MGERRSHPLNQSRFFKLKSPAQLADVLRLSTSDVKTLLTASENYVRFATDAGRDVQWPKPTLRGAQKRAATLLARIETPDFLHSAIRGRSYVTNANQHLSSHPTVKIDIRKFFDSVRPQAVFHFFKDTMLCAADVAAILTKLLTVDGHLPTGGNASPILSYFAYAGMFTEIEAVARSRGCAMTCYVDDMTITGPGATRALIFEVREIVRRYRLWAHKTKVFRRGQPKVVTGIALTKVGSRLPNKRQQTINSDLALLEIASTEQDRVRIASRLVSRMHEAAQADQAWLPRAKEMAALRDECQRKLPKAASR